MQQQDRKMWNRFYDFLPDNIYDAHAHFYTREQAPDFVPEATVSGEAGYSLYKRVMDPIFLDKDVYLNILPAPDVYGTRLIGDKSTGMRDEQARYIKQLLLDNPKLTGEVMALPGDSAEELYELSEGERVSGFKCYHTHAAAEDTLQAKVEEYLPEAAWEVAHERELAITLHIVRDMALADRANMSYIKKHAQKYPKAKLVLAHAARGFAARTCVEEVENLRPYKNIYIDLAAISEPLPIAVCIKELSTKRVMFGTDFPISNGYGKCVSFGNGFLWLMDKTLENIDMPFTKPCMNALEQLNAIYDAYLLLGLGPNAMRDIFCGTAASVFTR